MKKIIFHLSATLMMLSLIACNEEAFDQKEQYKSIVYLLSKDSYNVFPESYKLKDGELVKGYLSVGCGGSLSNEKEIVVELGPASEDLLSKYNTSNFDIETDKYARVLKEDQYKLETYTPTFAAKNPEQYVRVGIDVNLEGLSPDSIYFIPLAIKEVSNYEVNPEKSSVLYRVALENKYAEQLVDTRYQMRGQSIDEAGILKTIGSTKKMSPLSEKSIRLFAAEESVGANQELTVAQLRQKTITVTINSDNTLQLTPYGTIDIEQIDGGDQWNTYEEVKRVNSDTKFNKYFYLNYKYRKLLSADDKDVPKQWGPWIIAKETLTRLD